MKILKNIFNRYFILGVNIALVLLVITGNNNSLVNESKEIKAIDRPRATASVTCTRKPGTTAKTDCYAKIAYHESTNYGQCVTCNQNNGYDCLRNTGPETVICTIEPGQTSCSYSASKTCGGVQIDGVDKGDCSCGSDHDYVSVEECKTCFSSTDTPTPTVTPITPTVTPITPTVTPITPTVTPITPTVTPITPTVTPITTTVTPSPSVTLICNSLEVNPLSGNKELSVTAIINGSNTGSQYLYRFEWGDGAYISDIEQNIAYHTYRNVGTYILKGYIRKINNNWVTSENCTKTVTVTEPPTNTPTPTYTPTPIPINAVCNYINVSPMSGNKDLFITATINGISNQNLYKFEWGDGAYLENLAQTYAYHTYVNTGSYTIKGYVKDINNNWISSNACQKTINVTEPPRQACSTICSLITNPNGGIEPLNVNLYASATTTCSNIKNVQVNYADGTPIENINQNILSLSRQHTYRYGVYYPAVTFTDSDNNTVTCTAPVSASSKPIVLQPTPQNNYQSFNKGGEIVYVNPPGTIPSTGAPTLVTLLSFASGAVGILLKKKSK